MRKINFAPGPASLPTEVVERIFTEAQDWQGKGVSIMEVSHRSDAYLELHQQLQQNLRSILNIPVSHEILLLPGGARGQFSAIPLNLALGHKGRQKGEQNDKAAAIYLISGYWSALAGKIADTMIKVFPMLMDYLQPDKLLFLPSLDELDGIRNKTIGEIQKSQWHLVSDLLEEYGKQVAYIHCCYNETLDGIQLPYLFDFQSQNTQLPLAMDVSSCVASTPMDFSAIDLAYACAQKNLGIAGLTFVSINRDLLKIEPSNSTPSILSYSKQASENSLVNTPDIFATYVCNLVCEWIIQQGGLEQLSKINQRKAQAIYKVIDSSEGFYKNIIDPDFRSITNVVFNLADDKLEQQFVSEAQAINLINLKGHKLRGGIRASIYNAITASEVMQLCEFMQDFMHKHR